MSTIEIQVPRMGEGVTEATITKWMVKEGESVSEDQVLLELATDKVDNEINAPEAGVVAKIFFAEGSVVPVGKVLLILSKDGKLPENVEKVNNKPEIKTVAVNFPTEKKTFTNPSDDLPEHMAFSPLVRNIIRENKLSHEQIMSIKGSGLEGRITKDDILDYLSNRNSETKPDIKQERTYTPQVQETAKPIEKEEKVITKTDFSVFGDVEIVEMNRLRKLIAHHMVNSVQTAPHVTSFIKVDVTNLVEWRNKVKDDFERREGTKLTLMPLFVEAVIDALKKFPGINVSVDGNSIIYKKYFNIGMATALPDGNLIVPVIKNADQKNLKGLARNINDLAGRARNSKLNPDEITGGTFTITNLGTFGSIAGTPIINQPESAILAIGAIRKEPAVIETPHGDAIAIRQMMILGLTYDHRVIDGGLGGMFLKQLAENLENFNSKSTY